MAVVIDYHWPPWPSPSIIILTIIPLVNPGTTENKKTPNEGVLSRFKLTGLCSSA
jgi:hypothetical protein